MKIQENLSLLTRNTFRMDVRARFWVEYESVDELRDLLQHRGELFGDASVPMACIGEGSNLLFTGDYAGVLLHSVMCRARAVRETENEVWIEAESGLRLDDLIAQLTDMQIYGLENLSHIPGTVGASAVQNVGAYGVEAKDVIESVHVLDTNSLEDKTLANAECRFGYRDSVFKHEDGAQMIVLAVTYRLSKEPVYHLDYGQLRDSLPAHPSSEQIRQAVIRIRQSKLPETDQVGSAGSFFKNPVIPKEMFAALQQVNQDIPYYALNDGQEYKIPAAWLIEHSGCKPLTEGDAALWPQQPLVIVNREKATPAQIVQLAQSITECVRQQFGIQLQREVIYM